MVTVNVVEPLPIFPALSVADAESGCCPAPNDQAGPDTFAQVLVATPERLSVGVHMIATGASKA